MAKKIKEETKVPTEKEQKIKDLKDQIREIKEKGSFKSGYTAIRKGTVIINKSDLEETEKKKDLIQLCHNVIQEME